MGTQIYAGNCTWIQLKKHFFFLNKFCTLHLLLLYALIHFSIHTQLKQDFCIKIFFYICTYVYMHTYIHTYASVCRQISTSILANVVTANFLTCTPHTRTTILLFRFCAENIFKQNLHNFQYFSVAKSFCLQIKQNFWTFSPPTKYICMHIQLASLYLHSNTYKYFSNAAQRSSN